MVRFFLMSHTGILIRSFSEKAYKNGISSSNELCFGMSKRGHNIYTFDL